MSLVQLGMDLGGTVHHSLVVSKHLAHLGDWYTEVSKGVAKVDDLLDTGSCSNKFGSIGGCFNS